MSTAKIPSRIARWFSEAAQAGQNYNVDPFVLLAICERESHGGDALTPPGPYGLGDNGHGHGLMQIDDRAWGAWLAENNWVDPLVSFQKAAWLLSQNLKVFESAFDPLFCAVAAYNCGPARVRQALTQVEGLALGEIRKHIDAHTTDQNYATEVLRNVADWKAVDSPP